MVDHRWLSSMFLSRTWSLPLNGNCHKTLRKAGSGFKNFNHLRENSYTARSLQQLLILGLLIRKDFKSGPRYYVTKYGWKALEELNSFKVGHHKKCSRCFKRIDCLADIKCVKNIRIQVETKPSIRWRSYFQFRMW